MAWYWWLMIYLIVGLVYVFVSRIWLLITGLPAIGKERYSLRSIVPSPGEILACVFVFVIVVLGWPVFAIATR